MANPLQQIENRPTGRIYFTNEDDIRSWTGLNSILEHKKYLNVSGLRRAGTFTYRCCLKCLIWDATDVSVFEVVKKDLSVVSIAR